MDIIKFANDIDDIYNKCNTKEFAITIVLLFVFFSAVLPHDKVAIINFIVFQILLLLLIAHKSTSKLRNSATKENKSSTINQENTLDKNNFTEMTNKETVNIEKQDKEDTSKQKTKRVYTKSPPPQGEIVTQEAADILGLRPEVLIVLRKYKKDAQEYNLDTDDSYGPPYKQTRKNGSVTYLESEIRRHSTLLQEGKLQYITEAEHYERINKHNLKKKKH